MSTITDDPGFRSGMECSLRGEHAAAVAALESAVSRFPDNPAGHYQLGMAHQRRGEAILPPSLREKEAKTMLGDLASSLLGLGVVAASKAIGQTDWIVNYRESFRASVAAFRKAIELSPDDPRPHYALALSLRYLGLTEAAADEAAQAASLHPNDPH